MIARLTSLWRNLVHRKRVECDLDDEMRATFELLVDEHMQAGMRAHEARRAATLEMGGVENVKDRVRDVKAGNVVDGFLKDVLYAARQLRRNPVFALTASLSLAIGIGANTTVFTVANALLLRPPAGVFEPHRLVDIGTSRHRGEFGTGSYPNYLDIRQRTTTLDGVYAYPIFPQSMSLGIGGAGEPSSERIVGTLVTINYFTVLGSVPAAGRLFGAGDSEQPGASPIAVLSYRFWTRRFNNDPTIVGRSLTINGFPFSIVGVASEGFQGTGIRAADVWLPMNMVANATSLGSAMLNNRDAAWLLYGGRLKPNVSVGEAAAELTEIGRALNREHAGRNPETALRLLPLSAIPGNGPAVVAFLALLTGIVALVLVIACVNLAGVLLARTAARRQEIAVRVALGAGRTRLVRQLLVETTTLFLLGGTLGLLMARLMTSALVSLLPTLPFPIHVSLALESRGIAFTTGLVLIAALLSGLSPALQASRADVVSALKDDAWEPTQLRARNAFLVAQVAGSVLLVVVGALFARALHHAGSMNPGFDPHGVELVTVDLSVAGYTDTTAPLFVRELIDRVRQLPDVQDATMAAVLPGGFQSVSMGGLAVPGVSPPNGQRLFVADWNIVEPGYFATLRIPLIAGRDFEAADRGATQAVAIIGEEAARRFWPGQDPIGKYVLQRDFNPNAPATRTKTLRVVGVARDPAYGSLVDNTTGLRVYVPLQQQYFRNSTIIVVRTKDGRRITDAVRALVTSMNPNLSIVQTQTADDYSALALAPQRLAMSVSGSLGLFAVLLAAIGIYGATAYAVTRRTREIGIRMALGAQRSDVVRMVLRQGMSLTVAGSVIGLVLATAANHLLTAYLYGLSPLDPVAFSAAAVFLPMVGLVACYVPVRRATLINATEALRYE
jgi:predicted permease